MHPHVPHSRRHVVHLLAFMFIAWLLILTASLSIAVLGRWYVEKADQPKPVSLVLYSAGCVSILVNFSLISLAFDGLQRAIQTTTPFIHWRSTPVFAAILVVESVQLYFYTTVTRPDQVHNYTGMQHEISGTMSLIITFLF